MVKNIVLFAKWFTFIPKMWTIQIIITIRVITDNISSNYYQIFVGLNFLVIYFLLR